MSMQDPLSDMLTRIRNAQMRGMKSVTMPSSKAKVSVAKVLEDEGYIGGHSVAGDVKKELSIELKYHNGEAVISELHRMSKPSLRAYVSAADLPTVRGGLGVAIISTSRGVMTDRSARGQGIGGEVLCTVF